MSLIQELNFKLTVDEVNILLQALGNMPYVKVFKVIGKIQAQGGPQLNEVTQNGESEPLKEITKK